MGIYVDMRQLCFEGKMRNVQIKRQYEVSAHPFRARYRSEKFIIKEKDKWDSIIATPNKL